MLAGALAIALMGGVAWRLTNGRISIVNCSPLVADLLAEDPA